jgi:hypothetical protein
MVDQLSWEGLPESLCLFVSRVASNFMGNWFFNSRNGKHMLAVNSAPAWCDTILQGELLPLANWGFVLEAPSANFVRSALPLFIIARNSFSPDRGES